MTLARFAHLCDSDSATTQEKCKEENSSCRGYSGMRSKLLGSSPCLVQQSKQRVLLLGCYGSRCGNLLRRPLLCHLSMQAGVCVGGNDVLCSRAGAWFRLRWRPLAVPAALEWWTLSSRQHPPTGSPAARMTNTTGDRRGSCLIISQDASRAGCRRVLCSRLLNPNANDDLPNFKCRRTGANEQGAALHAALGVSH